MNRNALFALLILMCGANAPAIAQDARINSDQNKLTKQASFNETYRKCMSGPSCTLQMRLQLLDDLYAQMGQDIRQIKQGCSQAGYKDCINSKQAEVQDWHRVNERMVGIMQTMEGLSDDLLARNGQN